MITVANYWECISNKTKTLFNVLAKKTFSQPLFLKIAVPMKWIKAWMKKKIFLLEKSNRETAVVEWYQDMLF